MFNITVETLRLNKFSVQMYFTFVSAGMFLYGQLLLIVKIDKSTLWEENLNNNKYTATFNILYMSIDI